MARTIAKSIQLRVEFVKYRSNTMEADSPAFLSACETRKDEIIKLLRSQVVPVDQASKTLRMLGARQFSEAHINEMQTELVERISDDLAAADRTLLRPCNYMVASDWEKLKNPSLDFNAKCVVAINRVLRIGCARPSGPSYAALLAAILLAGHRRPVAEMDVEANKVIGQLNDLKSRCKLCARGASQPPCSAHPSDAGEFKRIHADFYQMAYSAEPHCPSKVDEASVDGLRKVLPARRAHASVAEPRSLATEGSGTPRRINRVRTGFWPMVQLDLKDNQEAAPVESLSVEAMSEEFRGTVKRRPAAAKGAGNGAGMKRPAGTAATPAKAQETEEKHTPTIKTKKDTPTATAKKETPKAKANNETPTAKKLTYPGTKYADPVRIGEFIIYTAVKDQKWRVKPSWSRVDKAFSWKLHDPKEVWSCVCAHVADKKKLSRGSPARGSPALAFWTRRIGNIIGHLGAHGYQPGIGGANGSRGCLIREQRQGRLFERQFAAPAMKTGDRAVMQLAVFDVAVWSNASGAYEQYTDFAGFSLADRASLTVGLNLFVYDQSTVRAVLAQGRALTAAEAALRVGSSSTAATSPPAGEPAPLVYDPGRSLLELGRAGGTARDPLGILSGARPGGTAGPSAFASRGGAASFLRRERVPAAFADRRGAGWQERAQASAAGAPPRAARDGPGPSGGQQAGRLDTSFAAKVGSRGGLGLPGGRYDFEARAPWYLYNESVEGGLDKRGAVRVPVFSRELVQGDRREIRVKIRRGDLPAGGWAQAALRLRLSKPPDGLDFDHWDREASLGLVLRGSPDAQSGGGRAKLYIPPRGDPAAAPGSARRKWAFEGGSR
ncbi:unnamed protein product [Prorocentrum cordatum]|uniref:Uncharacterized protein n=1 Tax=Prorocentrum cordatum TaxID=2364126 RepID=A0ABN9SEL9_9DINO|nr:unnamed protein product [Polarella glacialis]